MRKIIIALALVAMLMLAFLMGRKLGIRHALDNAEYWVLDFQEHEDYDWDLHIYLDGEHYINGLYIG